MANNSLIKCRVCGREVSEFAPTCPGCGDLVAYRFGHAPKPAQSTTKGPLWWIGLIVVVLVVYSCMRAIPVANQGASTISDADAPAVLPPAYSLKVISTQCEKRGRYDQAKATVQNTGNLTVPFAKAFFQFTNDAGQAIGNDDSYFSPTDIPAGATASADVMASGLSGTTHCGLLTVQDGDGNAVLLQ